MTTKKINLLFLVWATSYGGAERFVLNIIKNLDKTKYNISVFSDNPNPGQLHDDFVKAGAKTIYAKNNIWKHPIKYTKEIQSVIKNNNIDIIHANNDQNMFFALYKKQKSVKFIAHAHNTSFQLTRFRIINKIAAYILSKYITKHADIRLSCGKEAGNATFLKHEYKIIPNCTDINSYMYNEKTRNILRSEYNIEKNTTVLLTVGRLVEQKNHTFLIDVFSKYKSINPDSKLFIIGDGLLENVLKEKVKNLGLTSDIYILPSKKNISDYYNIADAFIMTSLYEGMPYVTVEAQANGLKCFFSDTISKEADHSHDSVFISLDSKPEHWAKVISSHSLKRTETRTKSVTKYDIENMIDKIDKIYTSINC